MDAITRPPAPRNEPVRDYAPGTPHHDSLKQTLTVVAAEQFDLTATIDGAQRMPRGRPIQVVAPHNHQHVLGVTANSTTDDAEAAIAAALRAGRAWRRMPFDDRAAILLRAADLLTGAWRDTLNAATMLGQSKTAAQAEIDAACELADFWRFNVHFAHRILTEQPDSAPGTWNRVDYRPLEGFVYAISPFNFTAIAGNLPTAPALMGNTVLWKPAPTQGLAAHLTLRLLEEAGLPPGVINLLPGDGIAVSDVALSHPYLAGIHFTGSTTTFQHLWQRVGANIGRYRSYPRLVGETGGKGFVLAHRSADPNVLRTALVRAAFEYQGQKCSAASRAFIARSLWTRIRDDLAAEVDALPMGDPTDFDNALGAVIDRRAYDRLTDVLDAASHSTQLDVLAGGTADDSKGFFVRPTLVVSADPTHDVFVREFFGPILAVHVYDDHDFDHVLHHIDDGSTYGLTGAIMARDRTAIHDARNKLQFTAGNLYINDKPTGAVVGQQPFGGARASGTNDKAGSLYNLLRWTNPRTTKETLSHPYALRFPTGPDSVPAGPPVAADPGT